MRMPICMICGTPAIHQQPPKGGEWVKFADYVDQGFSMADHDGLEYFCGNHVAAARALAAKTSTDALADLKKQFADCPQYNEEPMPSLWQRVFSKKKNG